MEGKKLISTVKYGDVTIERFVDESEMNRLCNNDGTDMGEMTIYEKVTAPPRREVQYFTKAELKKFNKKPKWPKPKKLQKLSKLGSGFERIARQQLADRRSITKDYSISFEQWCREQYDVDASA